MSRAGARAGQQRQFADIGVRRSRQRPRAHGGQRGRLDAEHRIIVRAECGTDLGQVSGSCCSLTGRSDPDPGGLFFLAQGVSRPTRYPLRRVPPVSSGTSRHLGHDRPGGHRRADPAADHPADLAAAGPGPHQLSHRRGAPHLPVQGYTVEGKDALPTSGFESPAELSWSGAAGAMISTVADLQVWAPATGPCCHHPCSASGWNWSLCRCLRINGARWLR